MEARFEFRGTGAELFGKLFVGALLTGITLGIYAPWFMVDLYKYLYSRTKIRGTANGDLQLEFDGTGGELFKVGLVGGLLTSITFGIYAPWFLVNLSKFMQNHARGLAADGTVYQLDLSITGGELFGAAIVGAILTGITFGIYAPWFMCKMQKLFADKTTLKRNGQAYGKFDYTAQGGDLFATFLVGAILTSITFGIYSAWFQVKMIKFSANHTTLTVNGRTYSGDFVGTGGELFKVLLVGGLLTALTLGIYGFWFLANQLKFQLDNLVYKTGAAQPSLEGGRMPVLAGSA